MYHNLLPVALGPKVMSRLRVVAAFARAGKGNNGRVTVRASYSRFSGAKIARYATLGTYIAAFAVIEDLCSRFRRLGLVSVLVVDGCHCIGLSSERARPGHVSPHEDCSVGLQVGFDDDIGPLADT